MQGSRRSRSAHPSRWVALAVAGVVAVSTGCARSDGDRLDEAVARALEAGSARFELTLTLRGTALPSGTLVIEAVGEADLGSRTSRMTADLGGAEPTELVVTPEALFVRGGLLATVAGDAWVRLTAATPGLGALADGAIPDPVALLLRLRGATDVVDHGGVTLDGADARHLTATVARDRADATASPEAVGRGATTTLPPIDLPDELAIDVWVDGRGLPLRLSSTFTVVHPRLGTIDQEVVLDLADHGATGDVAVPREGVIDGDDLPATPSPPA